MRAVATAPYRAILLCLLLGLRGLEALLAGAPAAHGPRLRQAAKAGCCPRSVFLTLRQSAGLPTGQQQDGQAPARTPSLHELVQGADQQLRNGRARQSPATKSLASRRKHEEAAPVSAAPSGTMVAWVIPSKPAVRDQLTLEQAARVHAAIRMLRAGEEVPAVMCFCGGDLAGGTARAASSTLGSDAALHVSPAALAYRWLPLPLTQTPNPSPNPSPNHPNPNPGVQFLPRGGRGAGRRRQPHVLRGRAALHRRARWHGLDRARLPQPTPLVRRGGGAS
eukprot:scaffold19831_cov62-Phaeocystis_antarctica.AAC.1